MPGVQLYIPWTFRAVECQRAQQHSGVLRTRGFVGCIAEIEVVCSTLGAARGAVCGCLASIYGCGDGGIGANGLVCMAVTEC